MAARTACGRILANICGILGSARIHSAHAQKESKDSVELMFKIGAQLLTDGSLDVRQEAKRIFIILMEMTEFEKILRISISTEIIQKIRKQLDSVAKMMKAK